MTESHYHFRLIEDPGHAWLEVPRLLIRALGIEEEISGYSYQRKGLVYLEEDLDAGILITALQDRGAEMTIEHLETDESSFVRTLRRYDPLD